MCEARIETFNTYRNATRWVIFPHWEEEEMVTETVIQM